MLPIFNHNSDILLIYKNPVNCTLYDVSSNSISNKRGGKAWMKFIFSLERNSLNDSEY